MAPFILFPSRGCSGKLISRFWSGRLGVALAIWFLVVSFHLRLASGAGARGGSDCFVSGLGIFRLPDFRHIGLIPPKKNDDVLGQAFNPAGPGEPRPLISEMGWLLLFSSWLRVWALGMAPWLFCIAIPSTKTRPCPIASCVILPCKEKQYTAQFCSIILSLKMKQDSARYLPALLCFPVNGNRIAQIVPLLFCCVGEKQDSAQFCPSLLFPVNEKLDSAHIFLCAVLSRKYK